MSALKMTAISVVLAVSYSGLSRAADPPSLGELVEKYRMAAESLADSESRQEAAEALFGRRYDRDPAHFDHLAVHRNGTVALRAVWEECAFHLSLRDVLLDFREERRFQVGRFIGNIEGRLREIPPYWWSSSLEHMDFMLISSAAENAEQAVHWEWESAYVPELSNLERSHYNGESSISGVRVAEGYRLRHHDTGKYLFVDGEQLPMPVKFPYTSLDRRRVDLVSSDEFVVIVDAQGGFASDYWLHCIRLEESDAVENRVSIRRAVTNSRLFGSGHRAGLSLQKDRVIVWGLCGEGVYVNVYTLPRLTPVDAFWGLSNH